jgi:preprotein translocase subunit SecE
VAADDDTGSNPESDAGLGSTAGGGPVGKHKRRSRRRGNGKKLGDRDTDPTGDGADQRRAGDADNNGDSDGDSGRDTAAGDDNPDAELVGVGAWSTGAESAATGSEQTARGKAKSGDSETEQGRRKKDRATPRQRTGEQASKHTTPAEFIRGSVAELRKVVYPTRQQLGNYFVVVLIFVALVIAIVSALDYGFGALVVKVFT